MIPAHLELVDDLPLTANGKLDRNRLLSWVPRQQGEQVETTGGEPIDDLERRLVALWGEVLGHTSLGRDDDFFAVGGDSLLLARLVGQMLEKEPQAAGIDFGLLLGQVLRRPTVAALATYLRTATPHTATEDVSPLVELTPGALDATDETAVVLVHEGTGTLAPYRALIKSLTGAELRLIGIEARDTARYGDIAPEALIERLAEDYARRLLDAGIDRVRLVGYCLGGFLATEIARVMTEAGARVEDLTVLSSYRVPYDVRDDLVAEYAFARILGADLGTLGFPEDEAAFGAAMRAVVADGTLPEGGLAALGGKHADIAALFAALSSRSQEDRLTALAESTEFDLGYLTTMYRGFRHNLRAITGFQADPYAGDLTLLRDSGEVQLLPAVTEDMTRYWTDVSVGDVRVIDVPGDHFSCLASEHATGLRELLLRQWSEWNRG